LGPHTCTRPVLVPPLKYSLGARECLSDETWQEPARILLGAQLAHEKFILLGAQLAVYTTCKFRATL
jgi:hypothetical protein